MKVIINYLINLYYELRLNRQRTYRVYRKPN